MLAMALGSRSFSTWVLLQLVLLFTLQVHSFVKHVKSTEIKKGIAITVTYTDASGDVKIHKVNSSDLSASWVWENVDNHADPKLPNDSSEFEEIPVRKTKVESQYKHQTSMDEQQHKNPFSLEKLRHQQLRETRKEKRVSELIKTSDDTEHNIQEEAIEPSKIREKYSIWRREHQTTKPDSILKLMKDQIILAKVYVSIARSEKKQNLSETLMANIKKSEQAIGEANSDAELHEGASGQTKAMGNALMVAKHEIYNSSVVSRKLRAMIQSREESVTALKKKDTFLTQLATKSVPKSLHCLPLQLITDYFRHFEPTIKEPDVEIVEDPSLYHYAIFSDNVLATSVVINSTVVNAIEPEKHVFHIVTDRMIFAAMRMWFAVHPPGLATIHIENIDEIKWLNASYCPVLRQLDSDFMKDYYFKVKQPASLAAGDEQLKFRNPKYLSMLNHLRFYIPELYPKLDKILFLDDDVVVQRDLTSLWYMDMKGNVNGAVETCKENFHRYSSYLNFSDPKIAENFDPNGCAWAFGMNFFDLKEWRKRNVTQMYHYWQNLNRNRTLWKLGSLPPGLLAFYGLTHVLDPSWHLLKLGYDPSISPSVIENAAVIHYNGNYKPWLEFAITKYRGYWAKYLNFGSPYLQSCHFTL